MSRGETTTRSLPLSAPVHVGDVLLCRRDDGLRVDPRHRNRPRVPRAHHRGRPCHRLPDGIHRNNAKAAGPEDLAACQRSRKKLHALGILHGDLNKHNFLVRGGEVVLVDFETAERTEDEGKLEREYRRLEASLGDPSTRGGVGVSVVSEQYPR